MPLSQEIKEVLESLRKPDSPRGQALKPIEISATTHFEPLEMIEANAKIVEIEIDGKMLTTVEYTCDPSKVNNFGFNAKQINVNVPRISWTAGAGWPIYTTYCPRADYSPQMRYPDAFMHQIVPLVNGNYFVGCYNPANCTANSSGPVAYAVNDDSYGDNQGYFVVDILSWS